MYVYTVEECVCVCVCMSMCVSSEFGELKEHLHLSLKVISPHWHLLIHPLSHLTLGGCSISEPAKMSFVSTCTGPSETPSVPFLGAKYHLPPLPKYSVRNHEASKVLST